MSAVADDLPWPELGNVSRGATRGNQGQKGVLGPPDRDGRCVLQLRVQPGVLAVKLNRQASEWYRTLDNEVNRALKLTKTYWRKARRRQDYDARADQDHMELHEWLQQLKDKTMSQLELLMQKGDIQGPPYTMPDEIELSFLRKFIERQAAGIPHNPRLRNGTAEPYVLRDHSVDSGSPEPSDQSYARTSLDNSEPPLISLPRPSGSPSLRNPESLHQEATASKQALQLSRASLARAQKETQDAFLRYTACLDAERQARQSVTTAEKRRDDIMTALLSLTQSGVYTPSSSTPHSQIVSLEEAQAAQALARYHSEANDIKSRSNKTLDSWASEADAQAQNQVQVQAQAAQAQNVYGTHESMGLDDPNRSMSRKHSRSWESGGQLDGPYGVDVLEPSAHPHSHLRSPQPHPMNSPQMNSNLNSPLNSAYGDLGIPPRKRMHMLGYEVNQVMNGSGLSTQNMALQP